MHSFLKEFIYYAQVKQYYKFVNPVNQKIVK